MSVMPTSITGVSTLLASEVAEQSINTIQQNMLNVENQLATGLAVSQPSDNPEATSTILTLQKSLNLNSQYQSNINSANAQLSTVNSSLSSLSSLLLQAQSIASANVGTTASAQQQASAATIVQSLITSALNIANTSYNGTYIFGGEKNTTAPYVSGPDGVEFVGSPNVQNVSTGQSLTTPSQVNGAQTFGSMLSQVGGAPLNPAVTADTRLSDLAGAGNNGVDATTIQISNGVQTALVDLTNADTLGGVVADINAAGVGGITASLTNNGIELTGAPTDNITVSDVGGTTAADLGIATPAGGMGDGNPDIGSSVNAKVTDLTPLSALINGAGLDPAGMVISNGSTTATITVPAGGDVQSLLNEINGAGLGISAQINSSGTGIQITNLTQGTTLSIGENGGTTATELGVRTFSPSTELSAINGGQGVQTAQGGAGDFTVTRANGTSFTVSLAGAQTVQDVINDINTADAGGGVTASFATTGNGIVLTDTTGGSGTLTVTAINASPAAGELGLTNTAVGNVINGGDVNALPAQGIFSNLQALASALKAGNTDQINAAAQGLQNDYNTVIDVQGQAGAIVQANTGQQTELQNQSVATNTFLSSVQDTNFASAISQFQLLQTSLQAALETTAQSNQYTLLDYLI